MLGGVGGSFQAIPDLRWEMASRLYSGMIYDVRIWPLRKPFQMYMVLFGKLCFSCDSLGAFKLYRC
jgi:hypothetical protein